MNAKRSAYLKIIGIVLVLLAGVIVIRYVPAVARLGPSELVQKIHEYKPYDQWVYLAICVFGVLLFFPDTVMNVIGAEVFGLPMGPILCSVGVIIGGVLAYWLGGKLGRDLVARMLGPHLAVFDQRIARYGFWGLLFFRLTPILPFSVISYAAGLSGLAWRGYLVATVIGAVVMNTLYQYILVKFGNQALGKGLSLLPHGHTANLLLAAAGAVGLLVAGLMLTRRRSQSAPNSADPPPTHS